MVEGGTDKLYLRRPSSAALTPIELQIVVMNLIHSFLSRDPLCDDGVLSDIISASAAKYRKY